MSSRTSPLNCDTAMRGDVGKIIELLVAALEIAQVRSLLRDTACGESRNHNQLDDNREPYEIDAKNPAIGRCGIRCPRSE